MKDEDAMSETHRQFQQARLARDARFDGRFFVAVKTTGIFCRPICPAIPAKEANVDYFLNAAQAAQAGYRPCLRCRPDSAPGSWAWRGVETTFQRALTLIEQGALQEQSLPEMAERLGITDRYLRQLFQKHLGMSPKQYAQFQQLMFAKQLLHSSTLPIADIGLASGFNSVRRFNDAFRQILHLKPSDIRRRATPLTNEIQLAYRPPLNWQHTLAFYQMRLIDGVERIDGQRYQRTFQCQGSRGWFSIEPTEGHALLMQFAIDDISQLKPLVSQVRRMFDLDADILTIEQHLATTALKPILSQGLRIPGVWSTWEAGIRAILGQQVSVKAAITQLNRLVSELSPVADAHAQTRFFPTPAEIFDADLSFLKMPQSRKDTLSRFAVFVRDNPEAEVDDWINIKGIGPWTIQYARLRGLSESDCFLSTDLVVKKTLHSLAACQPDSLSPWGSYATFHCWNAQS